MITYNVLIIDDDEYVVEEYKDYINEYLGAVGYKLKFDAVETAKELKNMDLHKYNLFLVDLMFGDKALGPEYIKIIRENLLTDILFYSSKQDVVSVLDDKEQIQGVFFAVRNDQIDGVELRIKQLLDKMISRASTPISTRGIAMESVAEIDDLIRSKIDVLYSKLTESKMNKINTEVIRLIKQSHDGRGGKLKQFYGIDFSGENPSFNIIKDHILEVKLIEFVNDIDLTDSNKNFRILRKIYKEINGKDDIYNKLKDYENLLETRNILAHVSQSIADGNIVFCSQKGSVTLSNEYCIELRKRLCQVESILLEI